MSPKSDKSFIVTKQTCCSFIAKAYHRRREEKMGRLLLFLCGPRHRIVQSQARIGEPSHGADKHPGLHGAPPTAGAKPGPVPVPVDDVPSAAETRGELIYFANQYPWLLDSRVKNLGGAGVTTPTLSSKPNETIHITNMQKSKGKAQNWYAKGGRRRREKKMAMPEMASANSIFLMSLTRAVSRM